ncbi:MAG: SpoIID/LytB domain-containing protein [Bacteroidota bacterium]
MTKQPILNVGIMTGSSIDFVLETSYHHNNNMLAQGSYNVELKGRKFILQGEGILIITEDEIALIPIFRSNSFLLKNVTIGIAFHWEQKEDQRFTGGIRFIRENGLIRVINTIHLEDYLKSVISSEMSANSSPELLKAHSVISRSWLLAQIEKKKLIEGKKIVFNANSISNDEIIRWYDREDHQGFDVCADDHCQRYHGITKIISAQVAEAVNDTKGEILFADGEICDARFSKCCGGISESFENNWEPLPKSYLTAVTDRKPLGTAPDIDLRHEDEAIRRIEHSPGAFCNTSDKNILSQVLPDFDQKTTDFYRWRVEYSADELSEIIREKSGFDFGKIIRLEPLERGYSGRIIRLRITGTEKTMVVGKELEIRKWLSRSHLYSSAFLAEYEEYNGEVPGRIILKGAGWGHGSGLCQIGAAVMGEKGFSYRQILEHYFRGATLKPAY